MDAAELLRDQFGDGKPPDITRKITACVACRKQKIKCHIKDGKPPCSRCIKRGLSCTVNKSLQTILQSDVLWKSTIEKKVEQLENHFHTLAERLSMPELTSTADLTDITEQRSSKRRATDTDDQPLAWDTVMGPQPGSRRATDTNDQPLAWDIVMDPHPGAIPGSVVSAVPTNSQDVRPDIISREVINATEAKKYLSMYTGRLDHFVYGVLGDNKTLEEIRASSSLLLAAVCAVGSLHLASSHFDKLYQEFTTIASAQSFSRRLNTDDVRGLCIGAFWLSGISWACVANAVRISAELQLHRSIYGALEGDRAHYLRTRLYYLVYVCDHHFSIPYGRSPMTSDCESIRDNAAFLSSRHAVEDDARLVSQLRLWQILTKVYLSLGANVDRPLTSSALDTIRRLGIEIDAIRVDWTERFTRNQYVGNYPRKGVGLHVHFAKLYLYSHAFRGVTQANFRSSAIALDIDELANAALLSATSILQTVVSDDELAGYLNGLPTYFDLMIAFAVVFVLKVSTSYTSYVRVDISKVIQLVAELVAVLKTITANIHTRHILASVAKGAETLLQKCDAASQGLEASIPTSDLFDQSFYDVPVNWSDLTLDNFYMGDFDFLSNQAAFGGS